MQSASLVDSGGGLAGRAPLDVENSRAKNSRLSQSVTDKDEAGFAIAQK